MIPVQDVLAIHDQVLIQSGGGRGVRDQGALESALARPFQTFGGEDLYPSVLEKATALMESIIVNHPFVDGNKRTGFTVGNLFLMKNGLEIEGDDQDVYDTVIAIASGQMRFEEILDWLKNNTQKI